MRASSLGIRTPMPVAATTPTTQSPQKQQVQLPAQTSINNVVSEQTCAGNDDAEKSVSRKVNWRALAQSLKLWIMRRDRAPIVALTLIIILVLMRKLIHGWRPQNMFMALLATLRAGFNVSGL